jgi:hypothetical protein
VKGDEVIMSIKCSTYEGEKMLCKSRVAALSSRFCNRHSFKELHDVSDPDKGF